VIRVVEPHLNATGRHGAAALGFVLFVIGVAFALTADAIHVGPGHPGTIKGDEAVYVAAALSAAFDGNLSFERRDLERFAGLYHRGPEGIFLKRGKTLHLKRSSEFPFAHVVKEPEPRADRLYFGKALIYPLVAAPFVRAFGLNGLLLLNVLLLASVAFCGYTFLAARSSALGAALFVTAFLGASALPAYLVFFTPEILNVALVAVAYFLWLYREIAPGRRLSGTWPQVVAVILLGLATYSKPFNAILVAPLVVYAWWQRQWGWGVALGAVAIAVAGLGFALTAAVSGEFNYQGGDRRTFYGSFPFDGTGDVWNRQATTVTTVGNAQAEILTSRELPARFAKNVQYFLVGRHFGFIPYFFPGVVAIAAWLLSSARWDGWRWLIFLGFLVSAVVMLLLLPFTWSGGGGPTGNRYLLSVYGVLLFLVPPAHIAWAGVLAWLGGALFTAKILLNPFVAANYPFLTTERGAARRLPVELTMVNDLPVMLAGAGVRARIPYGHDPTMLLYFLDQNSFPPEPPGMWVAGGRRTDIIVRTVDPIDHLAVDAESPMPTVLTLSMGAQAIVTPLVPGRIATIKVPARGVRGLQSYAYVLSASSSEGFVPAIRDPKAHPPDYRNLGALLRFSAVTGVPRN
jgi:hypothetical protein